METTHLHFATLMIWAVMIFSTAAKIAHCLNNNTRVAIYWNGTDWNLNEPVLNETAALNESVVNDTNG